MHSTTASITPIVETAIPSTAFRYTAEPDCITDVAKLISKDDKPIAQIVPGIDCLKNGKNSDLFMARKRLLKKIFYNITAK
ncbi:MAG: hypothetical protein II453_09730 [Alphaproteobacteria bacterium]|nr:hypothetical protein [Alphaproteobacteria bacterium]